MLLRCDIIRFPCGICGARDLPRSPGQQGQGQKEALEKPRSREVRTTAHHYNCKERCDEFEMTIQHIGSSLRSSQLTTLSALALFRFSPSFIFAVTSFAFQFPFFNFLATPGAFWYGLKRSGAGIPDPFTDQEAEADTEMVELSIWGYALCTWAAGVYGMVCGGGENVVDGGGGGGEASSLIEMEMVERMVKVNEEAVNVEEGGGEGGRGAKR